MCRCQNRGTCEGGPVGDGGSMRCRCDEGFEGQFCQIGKTRTYKRASNPAAVVVPVLLILMVMVSGMLLGSTCVPWKA